MVPTRNPAVSTTNTGLITPVVVTVSDLADNYATYESKLVQISDVIFEAGVFTTQTSSTILFSQDGTTWIAGTLSKTLDMTIPQGFNAILSDFRAYTAVLFRLLHATMTTSLRYLSFSFLFLNFLL